MKLSVSIPDEDVEFLDEYARDQGVTSRSAVIQRALQLLRARQLGPAYAQAWQEWEGGEDAELWELAAGDGVEPAS